MKKNRFQANAAFFNQSKEQENFVIGGEPPKKKGGEAIDFNVGAAGGIISEKGLVNAFKRAKQSGTFIVQNQGLTKFPEELCNFASY
jgi:hypothetical protein